MSVSTEETGNLFASSRVALPDRFEKTRLAVLSFSSALIVLSVATNSTQAVIPGFAMTPVNLVVLRFLIFVAATVYFLAFVLSDVPAARTLNRDLLRGSKWDELDTRLSVFISAIRIPTSLSEEHLGLWRQMLETERITLREMTRAHRASVKQLRGGFGYVTNPARLAIENLSSEQVAGDQTPFERFELRLENYQKLMLAALGEQTDRIRNLTAVASGGGPASHDIEHVDIASLSYELNQLRESLQWLNTTLSRSEQLRFRLWDQGVPIVVYAAAVFTFLIAAVTHYQGWQLPWLPMISATAASAPVISGGCQGDYIPCKLGDDRA